MKADQSDLEAADALLEWLAAQDDDAPYWSADGVEPTRS